MQKTPPIATDTIIEKNGKILLIVRKFEPFKGKLDLPGGFVNIGETVEDAAKREVKEETGLDIELIDILGIYSDPNRDPRGPTVGVTFISKVITGEAKAGDDAAETIWVDLDKIEREMLGFDHQKIIEDYKKWKHSKGTYWSTK